MLYYHLITNPGLEDIAAEEARELLALIGSREALLPHRAAIDFDCAPGGRTGVTVMSSSEAVPETLFRRMHSIYQAIRVTGSGDFADLEMMDAEGAVRMLQEFAVDLPVPGLTAGRSFAVRCRRRGDHRFRSPDVERAIGSVLVDRYRCPVNLEEPEITVRVEIAGSTVDLGVLLTPSELDRRFHWLYRPRVTLSTVTAFALLRLAEADRAGGALLDPFCGSGTIPVEAASQGVGPFFASDISPEAVAGTRANLGINGMAERVSVRCLDATDTRRFVRAWADRGITRIVCNPPYGVRLGRKIAFGPFYRAILEGAARILPAEGLLVMMSSRRRGALNEAIAASPRWRIRHVRVVETGGVYPGIFLLQRR
jgi:tRNA (guanine6-N2)-methyltransferase